MDELITTIIRRPYVFAFLAAYLLLAWRLWGWRRTILWLVSGYAIAWASEFSSIHNGFPYGEYHYIYENLRGELMVAGVPFFDSLSYPFLIFAGYATACYILVDDGSQRTEVRQNNFFLSSVLCPLSSKIILGALLTMLLDVITDPVAKQGARWFLGEIYWYAHPGWYFGVPLTNFAGWFLVPLAVILANTLLWRLKIFSNGNRKHEARSGRNLQLATNDERQTTTLYPAFYASIALFNIAVTFWIGDIALGIASSTILLAVITTIWITARSSGRSALAR